MSGESFKGDSSRASESEVVPVVIYGGNDNAISLARVLGRQGVPVYTLNRPDADVSHSRFGQAIELPQETPFEVAAREFLLGEGSRQFEGCVLLAASDEAVEMIAKYREQLSPRFLLDLSEPGAQLQMLDKQATYEAARAYGVPTPKWWSLSSREEVEQKKLEFVYPLIVKPRLSHVFQAKFDSKFLVVHDIDELREALAVTDRASIEVLLCEMIPGPDSLLSSYYTYIDEHGNPLFDFTKRIIRRTPKNMGLACYHVTDWVPEIVEPAQKLFRAVGLRGLANAEFKLDTRDGVYKLIECNARFTAANGLVADAGIDLGSLVYNRLTGRPLPKLGSFQSGLRLWDPLRDLRACIELRRLGDLSVWGWLQSVFRRQTFPCFQFTDPGPAWNRLKRKLINQARSQ